MAKRTEWDGNRSRSWPVVAAGMERRVRHSSPRPQCHEDVGCEKSLYQQEMRPRRQLDMSPRAQRRAGWPRAVSDLGVSSVDTGV